jgi:predicted dehydrogenase
MARHLFDAEPVEAFAFQSRAVDPRSEEVDEMTTAILRFPEKRLAQFTVGQGSAGVSAFRIVGTEGDLRAEPAYEYAEAQAHHLTVGGHSRTSHFPRRDQFAPELIHFSQCILEDREPVPSGEEGLADVLVLEALAFSATIGRAVKLAPGHRPKRLTMDLELRKPPVGKVKTVHAPPPTHH